MIDGASALEIWSDGITAHLAWRVSTTTRAPKSALVFHIDADNGTGSQVTIQSMSSTTTTVATHGSWLGPLGEIDDESDLLFSPNSVGSGSKTTVHFTIPFGCTDTPHVGILDTYGEFAVHVSVVTSAGTFELDANRHRLKTP